MNILYYPDFSPPSAWLRRIMLFADTVTRIVPSDVPLRDSSELRGIADHLGESFLSLPPSPEETEPTIDELHRLDSALKILAAKRANKKQKSVKFLIDPIGRFSVEGHSFLHSSKMSHRVEMLLERRCLLRPEFDRIAELAGDGFKMVRPDAANLVLSLLADKIARNRGLDTATGRELDFALTSVNSLGLSAARSGFIEGSLATVISTLNVPSLIDEVPVKRYVEIRKSFEDLRPLYSRVISELKEAHRLGRTEDPNYLFENIFKAAQDFQKGFEAYKRGAFARRLGKWLPVMMQSVLTIAASYVTDPALLRALSQFGIGITVGDKLFLESTTTDREELYRGLHRLRSVRSKGSMLSRLL